MPTAVRAVHGLRLYGWAFTGFLIPMVVGNVTGGAWADRAGPAAPFLATLGIFAVGLGLAGKATVMPVFVAGRAVQGFAAGALVVALYVLIVRRMTSSFAPAPSHWCPRRGCCPGPPIAGAVTAHLGWRWVFLGLLPLVALGECWCVRRCARPSRCRPPER